MMIQLRKEHENLTSIELAKLTWYYPDNPLYKNPEHPTIKLAGEIGELLDLYGKHIYKPGFDWMDCKHCKQHYALHTILDDDEYCQIGGNKYVPAVLDELGDIWYYLRILAWLYEVELRIADKKYMDYSILGSLQVMYSSASILFRVFNWNDTTNKGKRVDNILNIYKHLNLLLEHLNYTIEDLTLVNYQKLVLDDTNHGWKDAR